MLLCSLLANVDSVILSSASWACVPTYFTTGLIVPVLKKSTLNPNIVKNYRSVTNVRVEIYIVYTKVTEGEQTLCWRFDDELWTRFRNVTFTQLCIFCCFFSTVKVANMLVNIVILQWYGMLKGYLLKIWHQKEIYLSFSR